MPSFIIKVMGCFLIGMVGILTCFGTSKALAEELFLPASSENGVIPDRVSPKGLDQKQIDRMNEWVREVDQIRTKNVN